MVWVGLPGCCPTLRYARMGLPRCRLFEAEGQLGHICQKEKKRPFGRQQLYGLSVFQHSEILVFGTYRL